MSLSPLIKKAVVPHSQSNASPGTLSPLSAAEVDPSVEIPPDPALSSAVAGATSGSDADDRSEDDGNVRSDALPSRDPGPGPKGVLPSGDPTAKVDPAMDILPDLALSSAVAGAPAGSDADDRSEDDGNVRPDALPSRDPGPGPKGLQTCSD